MISIKKSQVKHFVIAFILLTIFLIFTIWRSLNIKSSEPYLHAIDYISEKYNIQDRSQIDLLEYQIDTKLGEDKSKKFYYKFELSADKELELYLTYREDLKTYDVKIPYIE